MLDIQLFHRGVSNSIGRCHGDDVLAANLCSTTVTAADQHVGWDVQDEQLILVCWDWVNDVVKPVKGFRLQEIKWL